MGCARGLDRRKVYLELVDVKLIAEHYVRITRSYLDQSRAHVNFSPNGNLNKMEGHTLFTSVQNVAEYTNFFSNSSSKHSDTELPVWMYISTMPAIQPGCLCEFFEGHRIHIGDIDTTKYLGTCFAL